MRIIFSSLLICTTFVLAQAQQTVSSLEEALISLKTTEDSLRRELEDKRLENLREQLNILRPQEMENTELVQHTAMLLAYSEAHEQAAWVMHAITPAILEGNHGQSNDFRVDDKVSTGSATEKDYFLKEETEKGMKYDGFGFDRGHLAPSADFRWSQRALSESYFYSNMSPQRPEFNRGRWAELEGVMREYVIRNQVTLFVITGPVLKPELPVIERSVNKVSIPEMFFKVVYDSVNQRGVAFLMPNGACEYPILHYAKTIDEIEELTGINFFKEFTEIEEAKVEKELEPSVWASHAEEGDVLPLDPTTLPRNTFNTVQARFYKNTGKKISVIGTVVSTKLSGKGHIFLNLDKKFPNQIFSATVWSTNKVNFSYLPHKVLKGKKVILTGEIQDFNGTPTMNISHEKQIKVLEGEETSF